jgi:serine/threonine-protein kinase
VFTGHTFRNRYRIYDKLGAGGAATVYLARDQQSAQMVIVKIVHPHLVDDTFIGRFEREIDLLKQLNNPHIVKLHDWALREEDSESGQTISYIVTELVEGHTLADIIDTRGPFTEPDALAIVREVATGLVDIHAHGIVHRDIKSQNIMITHDNHAKLIDFGIAKGQNHATLTDPSHFAGTLYYAPPEQILETHSVDQRADIYSLGVVLYEILTGRLPVSVREFGAVASRIIAGDLDPITGVSPEVEALVSDMMAHRVEYRIASAQDVIKRIDQIQGGEQGISQVNIPIISPAVAAQHRAQAEDEDEDEDESTLKGHACKLAFSNGQTIVLTQAELVLGRSHPRDPAVPDIDLAALGLEEARTASRRHCRMVRQGAGYGLEDLGSMNGTFLNSQQIHGGQVHDLKNGDEIMIGRVQIIFQQD